MKFCGSTKPKYTFIQCIFPTPNNISHIFQRSLKPFCNTKTIYAAK